MKTIFVNWHGPFAYEEIKNRHHYLSGDSTKYLEGNGLYAITGSVKYQRGKPILQYIGITEKPYAERFRNHHILEKVTRDVNFWLGKVVNSAGATRKDFEDAEYIMVFFNSAAPLNERKGVNPPKFECSVISKFFKGNKMIPYKNVPAIVHDLPEVMIWNPETLELQYCRKLKIFKLE